MNKCVQVFTEKSFFRVFPPVFSVPEPPQCLHFVGIKGCRGVICPKRRKEAVSIPRVRHAADGLMSRPRVAPTSKPGKIAFRRNHESEPKGSDKARDAAYAPCHGCGHDTDLKTVKEVPDRKRRKDAVDAGLKVSSRPRGRAVRERIIAILQTACRTGRLSDSSCRAAMAVKNRSVAVDAKDGTRGSRLGYAGIVRRSSMG